MFQHSPLYRQLSAAHQSVNDYIVPGGRIYEQREYVYKALTDIPGISAVKPQAAFYMFPKIDTKKFNIVNDEKFALVCFVTRRS